MMQLHHISIICSDYKKSLDFYTNILGITKRKEIYREDRGCWMCYLDLNGQYLLELFEMKDPPKRITKPEATGLRHIGFKVENLADAIAELKSKGITTEPVRISPRTGNKFTFFRDPDGLPIEISEVRDF